MKLAVITSLSVMLFAAACTKEIIEDPSTVESIFKETNSSKGYTFYKNDSSIVHSSPESGHNAYFRVRFNAIAAAALTDNGKLPAGKSFPEGSVIVKDLYNTQNGERVLFSVLKKESKNEYSSAKGWIWLEYDQTGKEIYKITNKGDGCESCHSTNHRDNVRLFDLF
ncbi:MAG: cytochrome P460 family protein [Flavobacteriales bacterium]